MTQFVNVVGIITNSIALVALFIFIANYSSVRFERTNIGRALMAGAVATLLLASTAIVYRVSAAAGVSLVDQWWTRLMISTSWLGVAGVYLWNTYELRSTQRAARARLFRTNTPDR